MSGQPPDSMNPKTWLARAESCLKRSQLLHGVAGIFLEDLLFDAQQAAEKALKALLIARSVHFPKTHEISDLLTLLRNAGLTLPPSVCGAGDLSPYAVRTRYPGGPPVTEEDYQEAIRIADEVVAWTRRELGA